jgi:probable HAF family extracellular repeat protein
MKNNNRWSRFQLFALAIVGLFYSIQASALDYTITDLGTLGGPSSFALGINNNGQVAGYAGTGPSPAHAFLYSSGVMTDIGTLGGSESVARAINNNGQIVGSATIAGDVANHAFLYSNGAMTDIGISSGNSSEGEGVNDLGQVAVRVGDQAYLYSGGVMTALGTLGGTFSAPAGINNSGQIAGVSALNYAGTVLNAFLYSGGVMTRADAGDDAPFPDVAGAVWHNNTLGRVN